MSENDWIEVRAIQVRQPIGAFYIGAIRAVDLVAISYADIRRIEDRDIERIVGIQRPLSPKRVADIAQYVRTVDATFPTSIILAIDSKDEKDNINIRFEKQKGKLHIRRGERVAQIIDGQHRIAGLEGFKDTFQLNVAVFVDMDLEDKGNVFATINLQQTKVSKSLAYDLYEYAQSRSPQKTCHNIAKLLCREKGSPFQRRIKVLGHAMGGTYEFLTQATFVDRLLPLMTQDAMADRDSVKRGKKLKRVSGKPERSLIFRNLFIAEEDAKIARNLWNYFQAVAERWPDAWNSRVTGNVLPRSNGFAALMRYLRPAYNSFERPGGIIKKEEFRQLLDPVNLGDAELTTETYKPGTSGETALYRDLARPLEGRLPELEGSD